MHIRSFLLEQPWVYRTLHTIVSRRKFAELDRFLNTRVTDKPLRLLDVGCGPGTNAFLFQDHGKYDYLGVDINNKYIRTAANRFKLRFLCMNVNQLADLDARFDVILINSVTHHLTDNETRTMFEATSHLLAPDGECVVLDMVRPAGTPSLRDSLQRLLIELDRGSHCRTEQKLISILEQKFEIRARSAFTIALFGITLWEVRLFAARTRSPLTGC